MRLAVMQKAGTRQPAGGAGLKVQDRPYTIDNLRMSAQKPPDLLTHSPSVFFVRTMAKNSLRLNEGPVRLAGIAFSRYPTAAAAAMARRTEIFLALGLRFGMR